ncbi:MAG: polysaccharide deacetylase family protein [Pyrinomonadaceae bacterium]
MSSVLVYHTISSHREPLPGDIDISPEAFARQVDWLARWRTVAPLAQTLYSTRRRQVAITFDDGFRDNLTVALPLLEKYSLPATVFVAAGFIGNDGYLTRDELRELSQSSLITIGAHGFWHRHFNLLSSDEARHELIEARTMLEEVTGKKVDLMAWPYGECDQRLERLAGEAGYRASWSVWKGNNATHCRWRVPLGARDNMARFILKASGVYEMTEAKLHRRQERREKRTTETTRGRDWSATVSVAGSGEQGQ